MDGFVDLKLPVNIKRLITMLPGMIIIGAGVNPMMALLMSQVCLSFALPVAIIPMLIITSRKNLMGSVTNRKVTKMVGWLIASTIIGLNGVLLYLTFTGGV